MDKSSSENGFKVYGDVLSVELYKAKHNETMNLEYTGSKMIQGLKSAETLKGEYQAKDWSQIEKLFKNLNKSYCNETAVLVKKFETDMNKIIDKFEKKLKVF